MLPPALTAALLSTPAFPHLWLPHCLLMCLALRATLGGGAPALAFARRHPLSCWLLGAAYTFAGALLGRLLRAHIPS